MLELIKDIFTSPAGSFGFVFGILVICGIAIWKISHFQTKFSAVEKLESDIGNMKEDMHYIKAKIKLITDSTNPLAQRKSPISLTTKGEEVANDLSISNLIANHWEEIFSSLNNTLTKDCNPYDIQVESFKIGEKFQEFLNSDELAGVKNHAFKSGYNLEVYNLLFGIVIRDKYLSVKGFTSTDIDQYDPENKTKK